VRVDLNFDTIAAMDNGGPVGSTARSASDRRATQSAERERLEPCREVARRVILLRTRAGISQEELARRVGTSKSAIARLESGRHQPTVETLRRVAAAFELRLVIEFEAPRERSGGLPDALAL
jgi:ribosome-binding protein aMBF1 (putative translation factor)